MALTLGRNTKFPNRKKTTQPKKPLSWKMPLPAASAGPISNAPAIATNPVTDAINALQRSAGQWGRTSDPAFQEAQDQLAMEFAPRENALTRARDTLKAAIEQGVSSQRKYGEIGDVKLQDIYNLLTQQLQQGQEASRNIYTQGSSSVQSAYDAASQANATTTDKIRDQLLQLASTTGSSSAATDPITQLLQAHAQQQGQVTSAKAGSTANLETLATQMQGIGQQGIESSKKEGASERAALAGSVQNAISTLNLEGARGEQDFARQFSELQQMKGTAFRTILSQIRNAKSEAERQNRLDQLAEEIQRGTLALQEKELGFRVFESDRNYGLNVAELQAKLAQTDDPLERIKLQAEIERINSQTALNVSKLQGGAGTKLRGQSGLEQWMSSPSQYWGGVAGPRFREGVNKLLQKANVESAKTGIPAYNLAIQFAQEGAGANNLDLNALMTALNIFFGKY